MMQARLSALALALALGWTMPATAQKEQVIAVPGFADFLVVDGDAVWATNKGRVERWARDGLRATVPMTHPCGAMALTVDTVWVADCDARTLNRIDARTGKVVAVIPTGVANPAGELNVVTGAGSVWIASEARGAVSRVDPATDKVIATVAVTPGTFFIAFGFGAIWTVSPQGRAVQRIDPATDAVVATIPLGREPGFLAAGEGAIWVQEQGDGTVARIDPATNTVTGRVKVGEKLAYGDIDAGGGKVWLRTTEEQAFAVIDPHALTVTARVGKAVGSGALRYTPEGIWTSAHDRHTLSWWPSPLLFGK